MQIKIDMDKVKFFYLFLVLILDNILTPNDSLSKEDLINLSGACKNFELTKDKLAAVLRAYQCEKSETFGQCQTALNLGPYAAAGLTSALVVKGAKSIQGKFRNKNYARCSVTKLPSTHLNNFNLINFWPYFVDSTYASRLCDDPIRPFVDQLRFEFRTNNDELNKRLTQLQKSIPDSGKIEDPKNSNKKIIPTRAELEKVIPDYKIELEKLAQIESQIADSTRILDDKLTQFQRDYPKQIIRVNDIRDSNIRNYSDLASMFREFSKYKSISPIPIDDLNKIEELIRSEGQAKANLADLKTTLGTDNYDKLRTLKTVNKIDQIKPKLDQINIIQKEFNSYFTRPKFAAPTMPVNLIFYLNKSMTPVQLLKILKVV